MIEWIARHLGEVTLFVTAVPVVISMVVLAVSASKYVRNRSRELEQQRFENYHMILDWLVAGRGGHILLDSQIACVYELRKYKEYKDVSIRILEGSKVSWSNNPGITRLITEIDLTLNYLRDC
jgi:hypothetical protein